MESSVINYLVAPPSRDVIVSARRFITAEWWQTQRSKYDLYISALTEKEVSRGDFEVSQSRLDAMAGLPRLALTAEAEMLPADLIMGGAFSWQSIEDALHVGIAAAHGMQFLLTWNFEHINNAETKANITETIARAGHLCPVPCSPQGLGIWE